MPSHSKQKVLIVGAGIAGPCLAYWLDKDKFEVTVIEKAPSLRQGGQNIDVHGPGLEIVGRMGLRKKIEAFSTGEKGLHVIGPDGKVAAKLPAGAFASLTNKVEILRCDLANIFFGAAKKKAKFHFSSSVKALKLSKNKVQVTLQNDRAESFDLLVAADGISSPTRDLFLKKETHLSYFGVQMAYFNLPRKPRDPNWAEWYAAPGGKVLLLRPTGKKNRTSASVNFLCPDANLPRLSDAEKRAYVREVLEGAGWQADRIAKDLDFDADFYLGPVSQVKAAKWSKGRAALLGDAAYGPSPITGMGTTLAILGAYILAYELSLPQSIPEALTGYERALRDYVERMQKLPPGLVHLAYPKSLLARKLFSLAYGAVASPVGQKLGSLLSKQFGEEEAFPLPNY